MKIIDDDNCVIETTLILETHMMCIAIQDADLYHEASVNGTITEKTAELTCLGKFTIGGPYIEHGRKIIMREARAYFRHCKRELVGIGFGPVSMELEDAEYSTEE